MRNPYSMPNSGSVVVDKDGKITQEWLKLFRDFLRGLNAERAPGRIAFFDNITAADLADDTKFAQAGIDPITGLPIAGLGCGEYLGWALCNGNNGTVNRNGYFIYGSTVASGVVVGSDSSAHTHDRGNHSHAAGTLVAQIGADNVTGQLVNRAAVANYNGDYHYEVGGVDVLNTADAAARLRGTGVEGSTANDGSGNTGAASASDNRPLSMSAVPMMRV